MFANLFADSPVSSALTFLGLIVYKLLLDISYVTILYPMYSYSGFELSYSAVTVLLGFLMSICVFICLPKRFETVSDFVLTGIALIAVVPYTTFYAFGGGDLVFTAMTFGFFILVLAFVRLTPVLKMPAPGTRVADSVIGVLLWASAFYTITYCVMKFSLMSFSLTTADIYARRAAFNSSGMSTLSSYIFSWAGSTIFPCSAAYFFHRRKYINVILAVLASLFIFAVSGLKSLLFGIIMVFAIYFLFQVKEKMRLTVFLIVAAIVFCMLCFTLFDEIMPYSLVVRRLGILPARIANQHYEFFRDSGPIHLSNSIFSSIVNYPFDKDPADIIGSLFYIDGETHANTGIFADGYTNFGYFGALLWAAIFALLMKLQDAVSAGKPYPVVCGCFALYITIFTNSALFTCMMTHGFILTLIMVALIPKKEKGGESVYG